MNSIKKSVISLSLAASLTLGLGGAALATNGDFAEKRAEALHQLSLFQGSDLGFELDRNMTRMEALIMMVRLSGNEWTALYEENEHPFTDAPTWENADKYVGYAYQNGLITGISDTILDPYSPVDTQMYMTLVLRALGYTDGDSTVWDNWEKLSETAKIDISDVMDEDFTRGDMVCLSYDALDSEMQSEDAMTLADKLIANGVFGEFTYAIANNMVGKKATADSELIDIAGAIYAGTADAVNTLSFGVMPLDSENMSFFIGTTLDIEEGIAIEPMMSSTAHSVSLIRVKDGVDIEKAKADILENVNPYKWVCVGVEDENIRIENIGNLIVLVMDNNVSDIIADNFLALDEKAVEIEGFAQVGDMYIEDFGTFSSTNVERHADKIQAVYDEYLSENDTYFAIIPDKSFYAQDDMQKFSKHDEIAKIMENSLTGMTAIDLSGSLSLKDYYNTDPHWKQDSLLNVLETMGKVMDFKTDKNAYTSTEYSDFFGSYQRKISDMKGESIEILTSDAIEASVAENFQFPDSKSVYNLKKLDSGNPYDVFLDGATPLVTITNPNAETARKLVIFRDSFGSNLAPLMLESYSEIVLVDLRYMATSLLSQYVDFTDAEVLFLFSDVLVNGNMLLK